MKTRLTREPIVIPKGATWPKKEPYSSWKLPFTGVDRKRDLQAKLGFAKGVGVYFGMRF